MKKKLPQYRLLVDQCIQNLEFRRRRIENIRTRIKIPKSEFARRLGISNAMLRKIIDGRKTVTRTILYLAEYRLADHRAAVRGYRVPVGYAEERKVEPECDTTLRDDIIGLNESGMMCEDICKTLAVRRSVVESVLPYMAWVD